MLNKYKTRGFGTCGNGVREKVCGVRVHDVFYYWLGSGGVSV